MNTDDKNIVVFSEWFVDGKCFSRLYALEKDFFISNNNNYNMDTESYEKKHYFKSGYCNKDSKIYDYCLQKIRDYFSDEENIL